MHAGELLADGLDQKRRDDGGVDPAGEGEQDLLIADLGTQGLDLFLNELLGESGRRDARHALGTSGLFHGLFSFDE